jgi:pimeloyl-ACP methyl ester carboxylesterase
MSQSTAGESVKNVVLVHGGFVDGSGWQGVYDLLKKDGYNVAVVQNPTTSLADDVAVTRRTLAAQNGPVILVGHSYGGVVITEAGNDPRVAGLVYRGVRSRQRRVRVRVDQEPAAGCARASDPAAAGRLPVSRSDAISSLIRRGRER